MTATVTAAQPPKKPKKRRGVTPNIARMIEDYEGGMSIRAVAQQHGVSYGKAHAMLDEAGVEFRKRGGKYPHRTARKNKRHG